jgi:hypothetical protein
MFMASDLRVVQNRLRYPRTSKSPGKTLAVLLLTLFVSNSHASALYVYETANPTDTACGQGAGCRNGFYQSRRYDPFQ